MKINIDASMFSPTYLPFLLDYGHRYEIYYGGAGSGKSFFVTQKIIVKLLSEHNRKCLVVRKVGTTMRESVWQLFLDVLTQWNIMNLCTVNKTDMSITFINGSKILFKGMDDPEKIKSIAGLTDIFCEELTELSTDDYEQLCLRLRAKRKHLQIYGAFNPISKANWVYKRWFECYDGDDDTFILKTTYKDNPFLPDTYVKSLEEMISHNPVWYKIYALGEFCNLSQTVFTDYECKSFDKAHLDGTHITGMDFGYVNDPSTIVSAVLNDKTKTIYICDEYYEKGKTNDELARVIKDMGLSKSVIIADSAEQKSIEEIRRLGIYNIRASKKGPDSVMHGIQLLQQYHIIVHPDCPMMFEELENYVWQKNKAGEYINKPADENNHLCDALRYATQCLPNTLSSVSKNILF